MFNTINSKSVEKLPLIDSVTPYNVQLSAFYKRSFAYFTVKERLPIILTKVIDHMYKDRDEIAQEFGASPTEKGKEGKSKTPKKSEKPKVSKKGKADNEKGVSGITAELQAAALEDVKAVIGYLSKLKNEIQTNKKLELLTVQSDDTEEWNTLIKEKEDPYYFTCVWLFTECYVYRRVREAFQLTSSLTMMDPFRVVKDSSFMHSMMAMCQVANHVSKTLSDATLTLEDFQMMLRLNLWGNKCDLSLSVGKEVSQDINPITMAEQLMDNIIVDNSARVYEDMVKFVGENKEKEIIVDIVCDNSGYELYMDFCLADFIITKKLATHVRFHVKSIPWFVSDASVRDINWAVERATEASFSMDMPQEEGSNVKQTLTSQNLKYLGKKWKGYLKNNVWSCKDDHFWTTPHEFYKMRTLDQDLYNLLGQAIIVFIKGDLNYRKLMGEMNWPPTTPFETALREFFPCPLVAVRTVKADLISGLEPHVQEKLNALDEKWMEKGDYGIIQYSPRKIVLAHEVL